jgi:hypothetical protein
VTTDAPPPLPALPSLERDGGAAPRRTRTPLKWICGVLLVLDTMALLFVLSFANITAEGPARRALAHSVAVLTEVDAYLDDHYETIRDEAAETEGDAVALPDFPIAVSITPQEVTEGDRDSFRALLLERAGATVHDEGVSVMREGRESEVGFFSTQGAVRTGMDFLRPTPHRVLTYVTIAFAAAAGVLAAGLVFSTGGYGRAAGLGLTVLLGAATFLILAIAVRFALRVASDGVDDYVAREFLELGQELTWAPIRNGIIFAIGGGALFLAGALLGRWDDLGLAGPRQ